MIGYFLINLNHERHIIMYYSFKYEKLSLPCDIGVLMNLFTHKFFNNPITISFKRMYSYSNLDK